MILLLLACRAFALPDPHVKAGLSVEGGPIQGGRPFVASLVLEVEEGWHIYGEEPGDSGLPTAVTWILPPGFSAGKPEYPPLVPFESGGASGYGLGGRVLITSRISPPAKLEAGAEYAIAAEASWLACRETCVPGSARVEARVLAAAVEGRGGSGGGLALALVLAFLGGILLNLMPCVLPVISLKLAALARNAAAGREAGEEGGAGGRAASRDAAAQGLAYGAGILVSFWALAGLLLALRAGGRAAGWGFQFQDPRVVAAVAAVFFLVSLNFFGVFEVGLRAASLASGAEAALAGGAASRRRGLAASFASGLFATAAATPCTAPFMGAALGWALAQSAASALAVFTALALGMALPYVLVTALPGLARLLPRPGRWMESLRLAMGFPLAGAALWMAWLVARLSGPDAAFRLMAGLLVSGLGAWVLGRWAGLEAPRFRRIAVGVASLALILGGLGWAIAGAGPGRAATGPGAGTEVGAARDEAVTAGGPARERLPPAEGGWEPWSRERVAALQAAGRPVFVDFSADWCLTCKVNEAAVLGDRDVLARFREREVALLRADWTSRDDEIARELAARGRAGVPLYLLYAGDGSPPRVLPELLTKPILLKALEGIE